MKIKFIHLLSWPDATVMLNKSAKERTHPSWRHLYVVGWLSKDHLLFIYYETRSLDGERKEVDSRTRKQVHYKNGCGYNVMI